MCHGNMVPLPGTAMTNVRCHVCKRLIPIGITYRTVTLMIRGEKVSVTLCNDCNIKK